MMSLESAIRTCKVETGWANKVESDRFLNPNLMMCPVWNGMDLTGRMVCPDSFYTKRAGCNSAEDRVVVENNVSRPQYMEYINLNANGINGDIYENTMSWVGSGCNRQFLNGQLENYTGQFGNGAGFLGETIQGCKVNRYEQGMAQVQRELYPGVDAAESRNAQGSMISYASEDALNRMAAGCGAGRNPPLKDAM
jgi:hypothetical protein